MDGIEVCKRIKADATLAGVFVMLSGAQTSSDQQVNGLEAGADGDIMRPISDRELVARVQAMVRIAELVAANAALQAQVAEHKQADEALRKSIELLTLFASQAAVSIKNARLFDEEQRLAGELAILNNAIQEMAVTLDVEKVLSIVTEEAHHLLRAEWAATLLQDGDELTFATVSSSGPDRLIGVRLPVTNCAAHCRNAGGPGGCRK